jgi:hypothetical protein
MRKFLAVLVLCGSVCITALAADIVVVSKEFTRPSDTTAYTAGDVVSNSTTATTPQPLASAVPSGQGGEVIAIRLVTDKKSVTPKMRVHLYNASTITVAADNAAFKDLYIDNSKYLGSVDLPAMVTGADTTNSTQSRSQVTGIFHPIRGAAGSGTIYYVLETLDAFTPASGEKFTLTLYVR